MSTTALSSTSSTASASHASCTTAVPDKYGYVPEAACNAKYNFDVQFAPAVTAAVIFGLLTASHIALGIIYKKRYTWVLVMGGLWETTAFIFHSIGAHNQQNITYATVYQLLFLLAPLWINAFVYMTLARMVYFFKPDKKVWVIRAVYMSKSFVWADVATFIVQAAGGLMETGGSSTVLIGLDVYMAGLGCQEFFILVFLGIMIVFHMDCLHMERSGHDTGDADRLAMAGSAFPDSDTDDSALQRILSGQYQWRHVVYAMYTVLFFITMRIAYRIAEFGGGVTEANPLPFHEVYSYLLDTLPMGVCLLLLAVLHPGRVLRGPESDLPRKTKSKTRAQKKAEKTAKKEAKAQRKAEKKQHGTGLAHVELQQLRQSWSVSSLDGPEPAILGDQQQRRQQQFGTYVEFS